MRLIDELKQRLGGIVHRIRALDEEANALEKQQFELEIAIGALQADLDVTDEALGILADDTPSAVEEAAAPESEETDLGSSSEINSASDDAASPSPGTGQESPGQSVVEAVIEAVEKNSRFEAAPIGEEVVGLEHRMDGDTLVVREVTASEVYEPSPEQAIQHPDSDFWKQALASDRAPKPGIVESVAEKLFGKKAEVVS